MRRWRPPDAKSTSGALLYILLWIGFNAFPTTLAKAACFKQYLQCQCINTGLLYVKCRKLETESIPHILHPQLDVLEVTYSKLTSLSNADVYTSMQVFNVTGNELTSLGQPLASLSKLHTIIARENKLDALRRSDLQGIKNLKVLDVSKNKISGIEDGMFADIPLRELDLSQNRIRIITSRTLQGLSKLQSLNLRDNELTKIPPLTDLRYLVFLDISFNELRSIEDGIVPNVRSLNLERCDLKSTTFLANTTVTELVLADNQFSEVPKPLPQRLETLVLSSNPIPILGPRSLSHVPSLRNFTLSSAKELRSIHIDAFNGNSELVRLNFEMDASLTNIDSRMFRGMAKLEQVSFRGSGLETLDLSLVAANQLRRLDVRENPFRCDCRLSWLRDLSLSFLNGSRANRKPTPFDDETVKIKCAEPKQFRHLYVHSMPSAAFECRTRNLLSLILLPVIIVLLVAGAALLAYRYRHKLPFNKSKTAPSSSKTHFEKTYMVPANDYEGIYHIQRNAPIRLIPVTEL
ncbi:protein slit [Galendromus occidentalis]|uniref:Protein slit n=1 Tax=Galendromus occidentalis TaxID=34638 RepID=A0AAJ7SI61_9ACAR|nr:protein slit [Galendromus occidentalis]